jgi:hypothetical protein
MNFSENKFRFMVEMYAGSVVWDGQVRSVAINVSATEALIGIGLLAAYRLEIEGRLGGTVKSTSLS